MRIRFFARLTIFSTLLFWGVPGARAAQPAIGGELKQWHKVTLTIEGPQARETDAAPNPFTDYRMDVTFTHESGAPSYRVPGYFAADGDAANTSAEAGNMWRAHLAPDKPGRWNYAVAFVKGRGVALDPAASAQPVAGCDGRAGSFQVGPTDKRGRDFRGQGRLEYVGQRYLRFAGTGQYFLKAGADSPENFLAYYEFDGTWSRKKAGAPPHTGEAAPAGLHRYEPHARDWRPGDPTWAGGKGRNIIGALNYLAGRGVNAFSFLTYNVAGDGDDVWPFVAPQDKFHYDCSRLDQWQILFDHAQTLGLYLHFKLQETENDDKIPESLDGGDLGPERKLYYRELIARFGHELALNWNLGEENTQTAGQQRAAAQYIRQTDPYPHHIVVHTYPNRQDQIYPHLLGDQSALSGASLQNAWQTVHSLTLKWIDASAKTGRPWVVANDEQNPAGLGVPPDPAYQGFSGQAKSKPRDKAYDLHDIRQCVLWGNLMAGGQGVEYYFGYTLPQNDLACEDWRSRERSWAYGAIALAFFKDHAIPFWEMRNEDALVGNATHDNSRYCFARRGDLYLVYLPRGGTAELDLGGASGTLSVQWFNPRTGGAPREGTVRQVTAGHKVSLGTPPGEAGQDWLAVVRK